MDFFIIGDHDTVLGFSLSGIEGRVAKDDRDAHAALREVMESGRVGILLITERYAQALRSELDDIMINSHYPDGECIGFCIDDNGEKKFSTDECNNKGLIKKCLGSSMLVPVPNDGTYHYVRVTSLTSEINPVLLGGT